MKKKLFILLSVLAGFYIMVCCLLYFFQERLIFFPEKLPEEYNYTFPQKFEEISVKTQDSTLLNGLLFTTEHSKGLIFYLHGNTGSLKNWGYISENYTRLGYDIFILDYRGYGKSESKITDEKHFFSDIQTAYSLLKKRYSENNIIVMGYSIGTGPAAKVASDNHPRLLILQAPYFSLTDIMKQMFPVFPSFLLKYTFDTHKYVNKCPVPIVIFHGNQDEIIPYKSSLKLKENFKPGDTLITLEGEKHNGITNNPDYLVALKKLLD